MLLYIVLSSSFNFSNNETNVAINLKPLNSVNKSITSFLIGYNCILISVPLNCIPGREELKF